LVYTSVKLFKFEVSFYLFSNDRLRGMKEIGKEDVYEVSGVIPLRYVDDLLDVCQLNSYERLQLQVESLMCEGTTGF
jgi:hypothetical protein